MRIHQCAIILLQFQKNQLLGKKFIEFFGFKPAIWHSAITKKNREIIWSGIVNQKINGQKSIFGIMLESHLNEGNQNLISDTKNLKYGVSITDECIGWDETSELIQWAYNKL